ncbi:ABC transporter substrate-binding protein [Dactylosporangium sp. CA-092794]|uniref:ABC transporter substrate-binding protein n=1 Tax=Dactylosporangium sp. CA-092794 TaxID=3239929 RepID=UPI003D8D91A1
MKLVAVMAAALAVSLAAGCSNSSDGNGAGSAGPIKIGVIATLTGNFTYVGQNLVHASQGYFDRINASGGINGRKVELVVKNDGATATAAQAAMRQLVDGDKVVALLGPDLTDLCTAAGQYVATVKIPAICGKGAPESFQPAQQFLFGTAGWGGSDYAEPMLKLAGSLVSGKPLKIGIVTLDTGGNHAWVKAVEQAATQRGWTVATQYAPATSADVSPFARNAAAAKPDVVLVQLGGPLNPSVVSALRASGSQAPVINTSNTGQYTTFETMKDPGFYQMSMGPLIVPDAPDNPQVVKDYIADMSAQGVTGAAALNDSLLIPYYLGAMTLGQALKGCGADCTGTSLAAALQNVSLDAKGLASDFRMTPDLHMGPRSYSAYHWDTATNTAKQLTENFAV